MAEIIETADCYIWRETAPATQEGYVQLLYMIYAWLAALPPNKWAIRVPPEITLARVGGSDKYETWYECRMRLASIAAYQDWNKREC